MSFQVTSFKYLKHRDIGTKTGEKCQTFLIFAEGLGDLKEVIEFHRSHNKKQFFPYTRIYFYVSEHHPTVDDYMTKLKIFLTENALFGYIFEYTKEDIGSEVVIKDLLTNDVKQSVSLYTPSDLFHPMVDTHLAKDNFRISLFNCRPLTFYPERASDSM